MLRRVGGYLLPRKERAPKASLQLEREGYAVIRRAFSRRAIGPLRKEILGIYARRPADGRSQLGDRQFRYEMFNKSPRAQKVVALREILDVIEPLLGENCHIIANTCWRNPVEEEGHWPGARRARGIARGRASDSAGPRPTAELGETRPCRQEKHFPI